ncbi:MAG: hypothetical protein IPJ94_11290 [Chloroflexi bacterium]|nr:hypothetical protein [Chloroflexota bacterium]
MSLSLLDTTILSNFAHIQRPELIQLVLSDEAATTPTVLAELRRGEALGFVPRVDWRWLPVLALTDEEQTLADEYLTVLEAGEAECLAVAVMRQARFSVMIWRPAAWRRVNKYPFPAQSACS